MDSQLKAAPYWPRAVALYMGAKITAEAPHWHYGSVVCERNGRKFVLTLHWQQRGWLITASAIWPEYQDAQGRYHVATPRTCGLREHLPSSRARIGYQSAQKIARRFLHRWWPAFAELYDKCSSSAAELAALRVTGTARAAGGSSTGEQDKLGA